MTTIIVVFDILIFIEYDKKANTTSKLQILWPPVEKCANETVLLFSNFVLTLVNFDACRTGPLIQSFNMSRSSGSKRKSLISGEDEQNCQDLSNGVRNIKDTKVKTEINRKKPRLCDSITAIGKENERCKYVPKLFAENVHLESDHHFENAANTAKNGGVHTKNTLSGGIQVKIEHVPVQTEQFKNFVCPKPQPAPPVRTLPPFRAFKTSSQRFAFVEHSSHSFPNSVWCQHFPDAVPIPPSDSIHDKALSMLPALLREPEWAAQQCDAIHAHRRELEPLYQPYPLYLSFCKGFTVHMRAYLMNELVSKSFILFV